MQEIRNNIPTHPLVMKYPSLTSKNDLYYLEMKSSICWFHFVTKATSLHILAKSVIEVRITHINVLFSTCTWAQEREI